MLVKLFSITFLALINKFIKYGIVGFSGVIIDFSITYIAKEKIKIHKYISNALGFLTAATTNYIFNRLWTFHSHNSQIGIEYSKFILISLTGLAINTFIIWLLNSKFDFNFYISKAFAIIIVTIWNFILNLLYTF